MNNIMKNEFLINGREIGPQFRPFIIAEMSANHNGDINNAFRIIDAAKVAGADAVKIQTYTPDTMTVNSKSEQFMIRGGLWDGLNLYELYNLAHTPWEWHPDLFKYASKRGITLFSSPFDSSAVDLLEDLNTPVYKIASFEATDLPLIRYVASTKKPMIISTGLANEVEIEEAITAAREAGCTSIALLHCISSYPAPPGDYNLLTMVDIKNKFNLLTGLSDHTIGNTTAIASVALGASIIEKHFTLDRNAGGPDDSFSLEPSELAALCGDAQTAWDSLGEVSYGLKKSEVPNLKFRRSLYYMANLKAGTTIEKGHFRSIRPGYGISPKYSDAILGRTLLVDVSANTPVLSDHLKIV
jgi:N-acetylneuraminate synthase